MFQIFPGKDGDHYWRQVADNGEELARSSEGYESESGCRTALTRSVELAAEAQRAMQSAEGDGVAYELLEAAPGEETASH